MIPKTIHQTFKTRRLPLLVRLNSFKTKLLNREFAYCFHTDEDIVEFLRAEYGQDIVRLYLRINIGAAKEDFFRYALLYKKGGVYIDVDSGCTRSLQGLILPDDQAIIAKERNPDLYVQWALFYRAGHPFLERTIDNVLGNLSANRFPHDVHAMTGPGVYTRSIKECLAADPNIPHRVHGVDYGGYLRARGRFVTGLVDKKDHWVEAQRTTPVLKP